MPSMVDVTKPASGEAYTADVRANFSTIAGEISALQESVGAASASGAVNIGTPPISMVISVGQGAPGGATPGFDQIGSLYTDSSGTVGAVLYLSGGDGTWTVLG